MCKSCFKEEFKPLTKEEFFKIFPPRTRVIEVNGVIVANLGTQCVCDLCNDEVYTESTPLGHGLFVNDSKYPSYLLCESCWQRHLELEKEKK